MRRAYLRGSKQGIRQYIGRQALPERVEHALRDRSNGWLVRCCHLCNVRHKHGCARFEWRCVDRDAGIVEGERSSFDAAVGMAEASLEDAEKPAEAHRKVYRETLCLCCCSKNSVSYIKKRSAYWARPLNKHCCQSSNA
jgi:hypothetical protein